MKKTTDCQQNRRNKRFFFLVALETILLMVISCFFFFGFSNISFFNAYLFLHPISSFPPSYRTSTYNRFISYNFPLRNERVVLPFLPVQTKHICQNYNFFCLLELNENIEYI